MTKTIAILKFMASGRNTTVAAVVDAVGCSVSAARDALQNLVKARYIMVVSRFAKGKPAVYCITLNGLERSKFRPKTRAELLAARRKRRLEAKSKSKAPKATFQQAQKELLDERRARAVAAAVKRAELHAVAEAVVAQGRSSRTALERAWGGAHA